MTFYKLLPLLKGRVVISSQSKSIFRLNSNRGLILFRPPQRMLKRQYIMLYKQTVFYEKSS